MPEEHPIEIIQEMLKLMVGRKASDLFLSVGFPPAFKIDGKVTPISKQLLTAVQTQHFARATERIRSSVYRTEIPACAHAVAHTQPGLFHVGVALALQYACLWRGLRLAAALKP